MPKERKTRSISPEARSPAPPSPCSGSSGRHRGSSSPSSSSRNPPESSVASAKDLKEWDEVHCPVCMEHPHNAVLLVCTSGDNGCQPFMCDTSYRHSNCLEQYKKAFSGISSPEENAGDQKQPEFSCPLCRGVVTGWKVVEAARLYMNSKVRNCSTEMCGFSGCYGDLRKHARKEHPSVRPSEADPERQRDWRMMEQRRDLGDHFSTMQSAMGGEDGHIEILIEDGIGLRPGSIFSIPSLDPFFTVRFRIGPEQTSARSSRAPARVTERRRGVGSSLGGETYREAQPDDMVVGNIDDEIDIVDDDQGDDDSDAAPRGQGSGRPRRQLRVSDDETGDSDDGEWWSADVYLH